MVHHAAGLTIYFGDAHDGLMADQYLSLPPVHLKNTLAPFARVCESLDAHTLYFLHQIHSVQGYRVETLLPSVPAFGKQGDFLSTNSPGIALGVMAADCVPIVLFDKVNRAWSMVHAGWRGTQAGIVDAALAHMATHYGTWVGQLEAFIGPAARSCCYEVKEDLIEQFQDRSFFYQREMKWYFDLPAFISKQLTTAGVSSIDTHACQCTICNVRWCSFRRQAAAAGRQMTVAVMHW